MRQGPFRVIACLAVELVSGSAYCPPQQPATPAKPDRSKEAFIFESFHTSVRFEKDGTGTTETTAVVLLQSEAAVQQFGLLTLPYNSANEELRVDYVRARKRDGNSTKSSRARKSRRASCRSIGVTPRSLPMRQLQRSVAV